MNAPNGEGRLFDLDYLTDLGRQFYAWARYDYHRDADLALRVAWQRFLRGLELWDIAPPWDFEDFVSAIALPKRPKIGYPGLPPMDGGR